MPVSASPQHAPLRLALSETRLRTAEAASWTAPLVSLGTRASRYAPNLDGRQLVIAVSVPRRDFAAALIGCGWVMVSKAPELDPPLDVLRSLKPGTALRVVTDRYVMTGVFNHIDESTSPMRVQFGGSTWMADKLKAVAVLPELDAPERVPRPSVGSVGTLARLVESWDARLAAPAADLAIVGTLTWLKDDFRAFLRREGDGEQPSAISDLLLPDVGKVATWFTRVYSSARFADHLPFPGDVRAVILDGAAPTKYLADIEAPVAICVLDRSVADETAAEIVVQLRNTRGEPISIVGDLGWRTPAGVEVLAYTVAL